MSYKISVVVPCFNEEEVINETHKRLSDVAQTHFPNYEIIYVDDGSRDRTAELLHNLQRADPKVRVVRLSRNFGHQIAVTAGLDYTSGDAVVLIDADLQDPPSVIPEFIAKWREGFEVVYGVRGSREGETRFKLWTARAFYRFINKLSEVPIPLDTGDFRLMDKRVVDVMRSMPERNRLLRAMTSWVGFRQTAVTYDRAARFAGESKYPISKMLRLALDGIISFSVVPLKLLIIAGVLMFGLSVAGIAYAIILRLFTDLWAPGWTMLFIANLAIGGLQFISLGILGEYVGRIYNEAKQRPLFVVFERLGFDAELAAGSQNPDRRLFGNSSADLASHTDRKMSVRTG